MRLSLLAPRARTLVCSSSSSSKSPPRKLDRWHSAVSALVASLVLPMGFGGERHVSTSAWHGDKILGNAVAEELRSYLPEGVDHAGELTRRFSMAVSNENMAANLDELLTPELLALVPPPAQRAVKVHDCGTMVEACVEHVHAAGDVEAISQLARYLLDTSGDDAMSGADGGATRSGASTAADATSGSSVPHNNPKGRLLELGGSITCEQISGPSHAPLFESNATLGELTLTMQATTKKVAERDAASALLAEAGERAATQPTRLATLSLQGQAYIESEAAARAARGASIGQNLKWWPVDFRQQDLVAKLRNGESIEEWFARRPENVHRCVCAPRVFPSTIAAVGAWQARLAGGSIAMLCVYPKGEGIEPRVFVSPRPMESSTQAQQSASVMAHAYISELVEAKASERA